MSTHICITPRGHSFNMRLRCRMHIYWIICDINLCMHFAISSTEWPCSSHPAILLLHVISRIAYMLDGQKYTTRITTKKIKVVVFKFRYSDTVVIYSHITEYWIEYCKDKEWTDQNLNHWLLAYQYMLYSEESWDLSTFLSYHLCFVFQESKRVYSVTPTAIHPSM